MTQIIEFLKQNKHFFTILYLPLYCVCFALLERRTNVTFTQIHCVVDDWIPFCEIFIIPYLLWFFYVAGSVILLFMQHDHLEDFWYCAKMLMFGMSICLIIYALFPNGQSLRPTEFVRDNFMVHWVQTLYGTDTSTNVCPSIHVLNSLIIHAALVRSHIMRNQKGWLLVSGILCTLICLSTVFLKQHSFLDVVAAILLFGILHFICARPNPKTAH